NSLAMRKQRSNWKNCQTFKTKNREKNRSRFFTRCSLIFLLGVHSTFAHVKELRVYAPENFIGPGSLGSIVKEAFKKKYSVAVRYIKVGHGAQLISRMKIDQRNSKSKRSAHLAVGVDQMIWEQIKDQVLPYS